MSLHHVSQSNCFHKGLTTVESILVSMTWDQSMPDNPKRYDVIIRSSFCDWWSNSKQPSSSLRPMTSERKPMTSHKGFNRRRKVSLWPPTTDGASFAWCEGIEQWRACRPTSRRLRSATCGTESTVNKVPILTKIRHEEHGRHYTSDV